MKQGGALHTKPPPLTSVGRGRSSSDQKLLSKSLQCELHVLSVGQWEYGSLDKWTNGKWPTRNSQDLGVRMLGDHTVCPLLDFSTCFGNSTHIGLGLRADNSQFAHGFHEMAISHRVSNFTNSVNFSHKFTPLGVKGQI